MPQLPNAHKAVIPIEKLRYYALNPAHPTGKHKAKKFRAVLGLNASGAENLKATLLKGVLDAEAVVELKDPYGQRYSVDVTVSTPHGSATVRSAWIVRANEDVPRLTSAYIP